MKIVIDIDQHFKEGRINSEEHSRLKGQAVKETSSLAFNILVRRKRRCPGSTRSQMISPVDQGQIMPTPNLSFQGSGHCGTPERMKSRLGPT